MTSIRIPLLTAFVAAALTIGAGSSFNASAQTSVKTTQTTRTVVREGTPEHLELARFLGSARLNPTVVGSQVYDLRASKGDFYITLTQAVSSKAVGVPAPNPPVSLPSYGNPGDKFSISHCTSGNQQEWTFTWSQLTPGKWGWATTSYSTTYVRMCNVEPGPG